MGFTAVFSLLQLSGANGICVVYSAGGSVLLGEFKTEGSLAFENINAPCVECILGFSLSFLASYCRNSLGVNSFNRANVALYFLLVM